MDYVFFRSRGERRWRTNSTLRVTSSLLGKGSITKVVTRQHLYLFSCLGWILPERPESWTFRNLNLELEKAFFLKVASWYARSYAWVWSFHLSRGCHPKARYRLYYKYIIICTLYNQLTPLNMIRVLISGTVMFLIMNILSCVLVLMFMNFVGW